MNRRSALFAIGCSAVLAGGCAPRLYAGPLDSRAEAPYVLASGDRLRVIVFGQDNLANIYAVDGEGRITIPLIGPVRVALLRLAELLPPSEEVVLIDGGILRTIVNAWPPRATWGRWTSRTRAATSFTG